MVRLDSNGVRTTPVGGGARFTGTGRESVQGEPNIA